MWMTTISIERARAPLVGSDGRLAQHIQGVQVDEPSGATSFVNGQLVTLWEEGIDFTVNVPYQPNALIHIQDVLVDEQMIDPATGTFYRYRVVKRPQTYIGDRQTCACRVPDGT